MITSSETAALPSGTTGVVTVDLGRLAANWKALARLVAPAECAAVVKADAYGLGADHCIPALARAGCRTFFVATSSEAAVVRALAPAADLYVLDGLVGGGGALSALVDVAAMPVLSSVEEVRAAASAATGPNRLPAALHLCSGLNRLGLPASEIHEIERQPGLLAGLDIRLVMSHLASADNISDPKNSAQLARFESLRRLVPGARASLSASDGLMLGPAYRFDLVRPGYALYGGQPSRHNRAPVEPVVGVVARVLQVRDLAAGETVGYSAIWRAQRPSRIATIAAGYADGIARAASASTSEPGGSVAFGGRLAPIVGRVSMDLVTVDVTDVAGRPVRPGDWAELIGPTISLEAAGAAAGTIGYEVLTRIGRRFHRIYRSGD